MAQCEIWCGLLWPSVAKVCAEGKRRYGLCTRSVMVVAIFCCAARQVFFLWHGFHHGAGLGTSILATLGYATSRNGGGGGGFTAMRRARRRRRPPLLSTLLPMAATTHRIKIFDICSKIIHPVYCEDLYLLVMFICIFWEGLKILQNFHLNFVLCSASQIYDGDFAKFCCLLRIYELYQQWTLTEVNYWIMV